MGFVCLLWGIVAIIVMAVGLIPLLVWGNWLVAAFSILGAIVCALGVATSAPGSRRSPLIGLALCLLAAVVSVVQLQSGSLM